MELKVIQVNIYKGKYLDSLVNFLKGQDADFVTMQEVTCGVVSNHKDRSENLFEYLKRALGLNGVFHNDVRIAGHPDALHGNAVFSKYNILESDQIVLKDSRPLTVAEFNDPEFFPVFPRSIVDASVDLAGRLIHVMSLHGAWTAPPTDTPEALRQAEKIKEYLKGLDAPFIMGADMNTTPDMQVIKTVEEAASNFVANSGIERTTHPIVHKVAKKKLVVDYIFVSGVKLISIKAPVVLVSDHLPVVAELEF